jgi:hypothetical protein
LIVFFFFGWKTDPVCIDAFLGRPKTQDHGHSGLHLIRIPIFTAQTRTGSLKEVQIGQVAPVGIRNRKGEQLGLTVRSKGLSKCSVVDIR